MQIIIFEKVYVIGIIKHKKIMILHNFEIKMFFFIILNIACFVFFNVFYFSILLFVFFFTVSFTLFILNVLNFLS